MSNKHISERYEFRNIKQNEAEEAAEIERICFPPNEACSKKHMKDRVAGIADLFLVAIDKENGKMAGFLNGLATDDEILKDEFFTDASLHNPEGKNVMLLGLDVLPEYRSQGLARELVRRYLEREWGRGRKEIILTCLESKVAMYEKFGFKDKGIAQSTWGGEEWHGCKESELEHWKKCISKRTNRQEYGRYNVSKIVNINTTSTKEEQLKDLITSIQQVKDSLVNILDEYEEDGEADKADTLTEALDALEDAYDVVNDVLLDD